jgi:hypothetical protein
MAQAPAILRQGKRPPILTELLRLSVMVKGEPDDRSAARTEWQRVSTSSQIAVSLQPRRFVGYYKHILVTRA